MINDLSIAFRLALEGYIKIEPSLFNDEHPLPPKPFNIDYSIPIYINVLTLARNVISDNKDITDLEFIVGAMITEWVLIQDIFKARKLPTPILYKLPYETILKDFKLNDKVKSIKKDTKYAHTVDLIANATLEFIKYGYISPITKADEGKHIFHTHILIDILYAETIVSNPVLLEGHSGRLRTKTTMFQRLSKVGKELVPPIPFHPATYAMFGDKVIKPAPIKLRRKFIELAELYKWTPTTSIKIIIGHIALSKADDILMYLKDFKF